MRCCDCEFRNDCEDDVKSNDITCFERCLIRDERISLLSRDVKGLSKKTPCFNRL